MKVLVVGLDAACVPVLEPLFDRDVVPTLQDLFESGTAAPVESHDPPWTPAAWPSIYTGTNPGKHGSFGFVSYDGYDWDVVGGDRIREPAVWELLDRHGHSSVVVNVPVTHPPAPIDGAVLPGFLGPEEPTCHPEGILEDVRSACDGYRVYPAADRTTDAPDEEVFANWLAVTRMRGEATRYLADRFDPDFGFGQFQRTDTVFHTFPTDSDRVETLFRTVDEEVAATIEATDPDAVFVVSDHGIGPYDGYEFRVNEYLREGGYVETTQDPRGMPSWNPMRARLREGAEATAGADDDPGVFARAAATAAAAGVTTRRVADLLDRVGVADLVAPHVPERVKRAGGTHVDFANSTAYMRTRVELGVRINLAGREPDGVVDPAEYDAVRSALIEYLSAAETPDGEAVFEAVGPREAYFEGPMTDDAVDVVTVPADYEHLLSATLPGEQFADRSGTWDHKREGVLAAAGPAIEDDVDLGSPALYDLAPTVLAAFGVPVSTRMDGSILPVVDADGDVGNREYDRPAVRADGEEGPASGVEDRLADLGYLE
jgi:predicted AlkP superfamily phosphohydrolase/phosphomutase